MNDFTSLLQQGNAWLFIPSAILLGALHGLEPGHSKTMMAAFIVAVRGTLKQAVLLGLAATVSHTAGSEVWAFQPRPNHRPAMAISQTTAVWETVAASPSSTACFNVPRTATIKGGTAGAGGHGFPYGGGLADRHGRPVVWPRLERPNL